MDILPVNFKVLSFCGVWREQEETRTFARLLNLCYKLFVITLIFCFTLLEFIELIVSHENIEDMSENLFIVFTYIALCIKFLNFLLRKKELSILLDLLREEICRPKNLAEAMILETYNRRAKWCALSFMALAQSTGIALVAAPIMELHRSARALPFKTYLPYSTVELYAYLATYLMHIASITYGILLNVSFDSLVYGFTLHACGQISILCERCTKSLDSGSISNEIEKCVRHHVLIHDLVKRIESLFVSTVAVLFFFSLITLCTSIFQMSKKDPLTVKFLSLVLYTGSMLLQVFFYCWYGNELRLKNKEIADAVYTGEWLISTPQDRRNIRFLMMISQKELLLSYHGIFSLNVDVFTWILKTSYSAFNILQQMSI
ncbi:hypothetical protein KPH14_007046 [Odynerus spinipes]|uniref:Odorant receptor n=1 Tax=Odynerus spinipes TaxID=1348599 RepID=A0AAD9RS52_9HYME|nr:hypothetical protein KPH14_007046 [Odynerus spinipes]